MYTTSAALLEALSEAGVECLFANFGSDHAGVIEAIAAAREQHRPVPRVITAPAEMVAMSAAHGHAQLSGRAQAVLVHVECGTQSLGGAVHNAAKGRVPVLVLAGTSPATQEGELQRQPQRVHPVDPGRGGSARHRARLRELRSRDPLRREREADRAPRAADRPQRSARPGVPDGEPGSARGRDDARRDPPGALARPSLPRH